MIYLCEMVFIAVKDQRWCYVAGACYRSFHVCIVLIASECVGAVNYISKM